MSEPIADSVSPPVIEDTGSGYIKVKCQSGHILADARKGEWAGSRAEMLAGMIEVECDRCRHGRNP